MKRITLIFAVPMLILSWSCALKQPVLKDDPLFESFFEKARLIMTKEEISIYQHLPSKEAREEFIDDFWKKRDPDPSSEENENRIEFERRIEYANRWFRENRPSGRGWDTARGRILLLLGEPDERESVQWIPSPQVKAIERWIYFDFGLYLEFWDRRGFGEFLLESPPPELLSAIERSRFTLDLRNREALKRAFKFTVRYQDQQLLVEMPVNRIVFSKENGNLEARFLVTVYLYREYAKTDEFTLEQNISLNQKEALDSKDIQFTIPLPLEEKGQYYVDLIVEDLEAGTKYRNFHSFRLR